MAASETDDEFSRLWESAAVEQRNLVASRSALRVLPSLVVEGGFHYLSRPRETSLALLRAAEFALVVSTAHYLRLPISYKWQIETSEASQSAYLTAAITAAATADTYAATHAARAVQAAASGDASFAVRAARKAETRNERANQLAELQIILDSQDASELVFRSLFAQPDSFDRLRIQGFTHAIRMNGLLNSASRYFQQARQKIDFDVVQRFLFDEVSVDFNASVTPPCELDDTTWWPCFLYRLGLSDRQHLSLLSEPEPEKIASLVDSLIDRVHTKSLFDLNQTLQEQLTKRAGADPSAENAFQPPLLWRVWMETVHADTLRDVCAQLRAQWSETDSSTKTSQESS
ncbi:MAG: hypothetical protein AAGD07_06875 [Planctomycetota bacterium]